MKTKALRPEPEPWEYDPPMDLQKAVRALKHDERVSRRHYEAAATRRAKTRVERAAIKAAKKTGKQ